MKVDEKAEDRASASKHTIATDLCKFCRPKEDEACASAGYDMITIDDSTHFVTRPNRRREDLFRSERLIGKRSEF